MVVPFWGQNATANPLFAVLFFNVFLSARFCRLYGIWGAWRLHFERLLEVILGPFSDNLDFMKIVFPLQREHCFSGSEGLDFNDFWDHFSMLFFDAS